METEEVYDAKTGLWIDKTTPTFEAKSDSWSNVALKVAVTPLTLLLDAVTSPVQVVLYGLDEEEQRKRGRSLPRLGEERNAAERH